LSPSIEISARLTAGVENRKEKKVGTVGVARRPLGTTLGSAAITTGNVPGLIEIELEGRSQLVLLRL
jgi:hypothetical protein